MNEILKGTMLVPVEPPKTIPSRGEDWDEELFDLCRDDDYHGLYRALNRRAALPTPSIDSLQLEQTRWDLVRRWLMRQEQIYIPGIHQASTIEDVNEAVDRAIEKYKG